MCLIRNLLVVVKTMNKITDLLKKEKKSIIFEEDHWSSTIHEFIYIGILGTLEDKYHKRLREQWCGTIM